jgi:hypothetical protein
MNLAEYRKKPQSLNDFLPWASLVAPGIILNKGGSLQRTARFRGQDLDARRRPSRSERRPGSTMQTSSVAIPAAWFLNPAYRHALALKGFFGRCQTQQTALPSDRALAAANIRRLFSAWPMSTLMRVLKRQDELMIACSFPHCPPQHSLVSVRIGLVGSETLLHRNGDGARRSAGLPARPGVAYRFEGE